MKGFVVLHAFAQVTKMFNAYLRAKNNSDDTADVLKATQNFRDAIATLADALALEERGLTGVRD